MFVVSSLDLLLVHPHFLLIVPLYVLLRQCSVILSWAGCLYDPRTEIWLARPECLSFFAPSLSSLLICSGLHRQCSTFIPPSPPTLLYACQPQPPLHPTQGWNKFERSPSWHYFFHVKPCISLQASFIFGYPAIVIGMQLTGAVKF